jgi:hypothetical protein
MAQRGRWSMLVSVMAVAIAAIAIWAISLKADVGGAATGSRFTMTTGPLGGSSNASVVYIVDSQTMRLLAYSIDPGTKMLKLMAVRDISADARMTYYNNDKPLPEDVRSRVLESGAASSDAKATTAVKSETPHR